MTYAMGIDTAGTRDLLAGVLTPVTFVVDGQRHTLQPWRFTPPTVAAWDAWPVFLDARPQSMCIAETDWHVYVALPAADQPSTVEAGDALINQVCDALMTVCQVTHVRPARWQVADGGEVPVWQFEITI